MKRITIGNYHILLYFRSSMFNKSRISILYVKDDDVNDVFSYVV